VLISKRKLRKQAEECVDEMGDVFWDAHSYVGPENEYTEPSAVAVNAVTTHLIKLARRFGAVIKDDCEDLPERIRLS
jgi:hypothetical protein